MLKAETSDQLRRGYASTEACASQAEDARGADGSASLRVLIAAAEFSPLSRETCVSAFTASLGNALRALGHDIRAVVPRHGCIDSEIFENLEPLHRLDVPMLDSTSQASVFEVAGPGGIPVFAIENERYFGRATVQNQPDDDERYVFFSKAVVHLLDELSWQPNVVHCVEWHTALVPDYLQGARGAQITRTPVSVLTLCDLERYTPTTIRGRIEMDSPQLTLNLAARGVLTADCVSLNAEEHSRSVARLELLTPFFRERSMQITCIDTPAVRISAETEASSTLSEEVLDSSLDPMTDPAIHTAFGAGSAHRKSRNKQALQLVRGLALDADVPLIGMVCPLDDASGIPRVIALFDALAGLGVQLATQGRGEARYERLFRCATEASPHSISFRLESPDAAGDSARRLFAAADIFLAPGREQSGLPIALRYGAIPITPFTYDSASCQSIGFQSIGFQFDPDVTGSLLSSIHSAVVLYRDRETWSALVQSALLTDPHWESAARRYEGLYRTALGVSRDTRPESIHFDDSSEMRAF